MDPNARLPPISPGTSDGPNYRLPSISNLVNVASEPLDPPRQPPELTLPRLPSLSQQRHVKQHAELLPDTSSSAHHNQALAATGADLPYAPPASPLEQFQLGPRVIHRSRDIDPQRGLESAPTHPWSLSPARHTTTRTYAGPSTFHSSAPSSYSTERPAIWSHHSYSARSARASYPSYQNESLVSTPHQTPNSSDGPSQNLPSFASTFGQSSALQAPRVPESRQDASQITVARSREFETDRLTALYPPDSRRQLPMAQTVANPSTNTVGSHALPIQRTPSNCTPQPTIQFGLPQEYDFRPFERSAFSREPLPPRTQPGRNVTVHHQSYPGHHTAGTQERTISATQSHHRPPSPTGYLPVSGPRSTATVTSSHAHGYPVGDWRLDSKGSRVPLVSHSMSNPRSSVPASSSRSLHAPSPVPTQPNSRPVPSRPRPYDASRPPGQETPGLDSVSPQRPSRGRGARGRQPRLRGVRPDLTSDATRASSQPRKRPRRNVEKAFDPTAIAQPPPMITITPSQPRQTQTSTGTVSRRTAGGLRAMGPIPPRPKRLILQTGPEDLPRVQALLTQESQAAAACNRHMKKVHEHCKIIRDFARYYVKYKPMNVPQPPQSEVDELAHRVLCIIELCKEAIVIARRTLAERAGRDPDKEIASANAMLSLMPTLRQVLPATTTSNWGVSVRGTSGDLPNPLKRDHDSMASGTAGPPVKSQQEIEMELIRNKRMAAQSGVKGKYTKRNKRAAPPQKCTSCGTKDTPEWRRGPDGQRSLCNACGLHYAKLIKNQKGIWIGAGDPPPIDVLTLRQVTKIGVQPVFNDKGELVIPGFYRVPASQAQSVFIRAPSAALPVAEAGGGGVGTTGGGETESSVASSAPAMGPNQACGPSAGEVPLDGLQVVVDEDEDLTMPAGKRRRWKAAPPEVIATATRATSAGAITQPASAEPEQSASTNPESSQALNAAPVP